MAEAGTETGIETETGTETGKEKETERGIGTGIGKEIEAIDQISITATPTAMERTTITNRTSRMLDSEQVPALRGVRIRSTVSGKNFPKGMLPDKTTDQGRGREADLVVMNRLPLYPLRGVSSLTLCCWIPLGETSQTPDLTSQILQTALCR